MDTAIAPRTQPIPTLVETAGHAVVRTLEEHGIRRAYVVPGESYLDVLDGLYESTIDTIVCRHEGGAAYMAEAEGKIGRLPGIAMVTRGPGAANAHVGLHTAWQDSTPMILFVGLIPTAHRGREAFQEFDIQAWFDSGAKAVFVLDSAARAAELVAEAIFTARSGRPGPVVVGLPEDVLTEKIPGLRHPELPVAGGGLTRRDGIALAGALARSERPLFVTGGSDWDDDTTQKLTAWLERHHIPAAAEWRTEGVVPFDSPSYAGPIGYGRPKPTVDILDQADLLIYVGTVPGDVLTGGFHARQGWSKENVLVSIDTRLRGRSGAVTQHIVARPGHFVRDLVEFDIQTRPEWAAWTSQLRAQQVAFSDLPAVGEAEGPARMDTLMASLVPLLERDAIVTFGAGEHTNWAHRYFPAATFTSMLSAGNGSMGYSVPAAVAASLNFPGRQVVCIAGDGEFLMNGQELATAAQYGLSPLVVVMDNQEYGTIRTHQERNYPGRVSGTQLRNPNFATLADAYGGRGYRVEADGQVGAAVRSALDFIATTGSFALIHLLVEQRRQAY
ncbi:thiamine pyrophosphate-dependent enzyme [Leifsonia shinshuensis]|uniref:Acetolactate synthase-1/2/3 large subunit n=1 Tax=Leifsonia shinshuensis TaxID=150026 RepID=A0A853CXB6_9MICO|nr:thiamine pyrophosphate-dependent enzyme [Leifsonia shinshuensis]NYJ25756.1 acetolactate synthase-1/2/3 large subunit [Leifsonia shinshuensis]